MTSAPTAEPAPVIDDDRPPRGPNSDELRISALTTGNRTLAAMNADLVAGIRACLADLEHWADQAGIYIGVATQAKVRARIAALRDLVERPASTIPQLQDQTT